MFRYRRSIQVLAVATCMAAMLELVRPVSTVAAPPPPKSHKAAKPAAGDWRDTFPVDKKNLVSTGSNPCFSLEPGTRHHYQHKNAKLTITVLKETRQVDGVETRVIEEREEVGGKLKEVSRNFFAIDKTTHDVYYFGEEVDNYKNGKVANHGGSWLSGVDGARFGLMMPGQPKVGDKFYQELAPGKAMDRAEIVSLAEKITTPGGTYDKCVYVRESTPLENDTSEKWYAPGVGLVKDDEMVLVRVEKPR